MTENRSHGRFEPSDSFPQTLSYYYYNYYIIICDSSFLVTVVSAKMHLIQFTHYTVFFA